jgi:hypothetical protein
MSSSGLFPLGFPIKILSVFLICYCLQLLTCYRLLLLLVLVFLGRAYFNLNIDFIYVKLVEYNFKSFTPPPHL